MAKLFAHIRLLTGVLALALLLVTVLAGSSTAQQNAPNAATSEQQLLNQFKTIQGLGTIPDKKSYVIEHPAGREWQTFHTATLKWIGGIAIIGVLVVLVLFYLWRGKIPLTKGRSGRTIVRFGAFERFVHWLTASAFVVLAITGLNVTFGRAIFAAGDGSETFSTWSQWAKYAHNFISFAFTLGVVLMFIMWVGRNFPRAVDIEWLKRGGGMFSKKQDAHTHAYKFNAGQKLLFWAVVIAGAAMMISGYLLMFPFYGGMTISNMETAEVFHGIIGVLFIAMILGHIYIGTVGMEGAFEGMYDGAVDANWAKEHHDLWYEQVMSEGTERSTRTAPAE
ncbi:MAG: Formate dehydrogenase -O, gamma subunit [Pseudolabrys sp.]|jgi:formate dehydrogenase subunit gamma|nr:Formate dehydrogenase -O, gamma subunit [Pseudolabrys sp.]